MNAVSKIKGFAITLLFLLPLTLFAQETKPPSPDEGMDMFLLILAGVFISGMVGAAIVGAAAGLIVLFFIFGLMAIGALSASVAVGMYRKSLAAGFKSFLMILFGTTCSVIGGCGLWLLSGYFAPDFGHGKALFITGFAGGLVGGLLMALCTYRVLQFLLKFLVRKLQPATV